MLCSMVRNHHTTPNAAPHRRSATRASKPRPAQYQYSPISHADAHLLLSWNSLMQRSMSARMSDSSSTNSSGAMPPLLTPALMPPRTGWNRRPTCRAARIVSSNLQQIVRVRW